MNSYDANYDWGIHTVEVAFQRGKYKATQIFNVRGDSAGSGILENAIRYWTDGGASCKAVRLVDPKGNKIEIKDPEELEACIVSVRILGWKPETWKPLSARRRRTVPTVPMGRRA